MSPEQASAASRWRARQPGLRVDFHPVSGAPKRVSVTDGFLTGPDGAGGTLPAKSLAGFPADDPHRVTKAFLHEHRDVFGHGPEALDQAAIHREYVTAHNGLKTVVWEQRLDGLPVFQATLISHTTKRGELVSLSSQFMSDPQRAADRGTPSRASLRAAPVVSARRAVALAARHLGEELEEKAVVAAAVAPDGPAKPQKFRAPGLKGDADAKLVWLPMDKESLRLCWDVVLVSGRHGEMFRVLVEVRSGEVLLRQGLTRYLTDASFRVYTGDSPAPMSPGFPSPSTDQAPYVARTLVTWPALDMNASPAGWINEGGNETLGNNVDAHTDWNHDDAPDLPRPQGAPFRVFDFPMDPETQDPTNYAAAAVVQLFYLCNWYHDRLYQLGFTEAAGNFQNNNFARGGLGNDAVQADAQDGSGTNNANFSTPPDGQAGRMQMFLFPGPAPRRDGDFDAEIVLHEHTHGLSERLVGGGQGLSTVQAGGLGEGWSDFYSLALLSAASDDVQGCYANGAYASHQISPGYRENFYFGIRRYPYTTDLTKNPLTFKDIDPTQADYCEAGVAYTTAGFLHPCSPAAADEVHNQGEVWCVTLWEARAALIQKHGWAVGNELILQLVTDGMRLTPPEPNFLQARDAILQADLVNTGGANRSELWAAFAKRGMGFSATSPASVTTWGVQEAFDLPDDLRLDPLSGFVSSGPVGGPFGVTSQVFALTNAGAGPMDWTLGNTSLWLSASPSGGSLAPAGTVTLVDVSVNSAAATLPAGLYPTTLFFTNLNSGASQSRSFLLRVGQPDYFTEWFSAGSNDLAYRTFTFTPDGSAGFYAACHDPATSFPTDPAGGTTVSLEDESSIAVTLSGEATVAIYHRRTNVFFIGSNGYLTLDRGTNSYIEWPGSHFDLPRVAALFDDLDPERGGTISWKQLDDRVAITFLNVPEYHRTAGNSFQIELFFDGRIRLTYLALAASDGLAGLSAGLGVPAGFAGSDLTSYPTCALPLRLTLPVTASEADGALANAGQVQIPAALSSDLIVALVSSDASEVVVPDSVTLLAGQTNAAFDVTIIDDLLPDGPQAATFTASATGYLNAEARLTVNDNEAVTLQVLLPATVIEGQDTAQGQVSVSVAVANDVSVSLVSDDTTAIQVPANVIVPAGQTSAVFDLSIVDDSMIDGPQTATVTARVPDWTAGLASVSVLDDENRNLTVTLPASAWEDAGVRPGAGTVCLSGTLPTNLVVALESSSPASLTVPAVVTIPAGQVSTAFDLMLVDNAVQDGHLSAAVVASHPNFTEGETSMLILDDETPPAPFNPSPADLATNVSVRAHLSWTRSATGTTSPFTYEVYLGTGPEAMMRIAGDLAETTCDPGPLTPNTTFYWQVVVHRVGATAGPIWTFTTRGLDQVLAIGDAAIVEGNSGATTALFSVSLAPPPILPVTVHYATADGTAQAGGDYLATNGVLSFAAGQTNAALAVAILGDTMLEPNETFSVLLSNPSNAAIGRIAGIATIYDDDGAPAILVQPADVAVGLGSNASFSVSVVGAPPLRYQWQKDSAPLQDRTNAELFLPTVASADVGAYSVVVTNVMGSTISSKAWLTILPPDRSRVFANTTPLAIPESGPADPYPSTIQVTGLVGGVTKVTATLSNLSHTYPADLDILLVSPGGANAMLLSDAFGAVNESGVTLTFDDEAALVPPEMGLVGPGAYRPVNYGGEDVLPPPAPAGPNLEASLSVFNGTDPNGLWQLFVFDDTGGDAGSLASGWSLRLWVDEQAPVLLSPHFGSVGMDFRFLARRGFDYFVEFKNSLSDPAWEVLQVVTGDGTMKTVNDAPASHPQRFYRLRAE
ncbi:MAG: M36 family metallopeptidase [Verrucomicrobia bacterium]|nr:M36 family metallopeptidase [Verrucomicrobiota bacterium]